MQIRFQTLIWIAQVEEQEIMPTSLLDYGMEAKVAHWSHKPGYVGSSPTPVIFLILVDGACLKTGHRSEKC